MAISSVSSTPATAINDYVNRSKSAVDNTLSSGKKAVTDAVNAANTAISNPPRPEPSALNSLASGVLGLDNPSEVKPSQEENPLYTAGRVLAAVGTVGTIISFLV